MSWIRDFFRYQALRITAISLLATGLVACSTSQWINIATSKDPRGYLENYAENRVKSYQYNPLAIAQDIKRIRKQYKALLAILRGEAEKQWGKADTLTPSNKRYVKYTDNYKSRAIINFETGLIQVETLSEKTPRKNLVNAVVTTLLTPRDPRAVDLYSARQIKLSGEPYLYGLVNNQHGQAISSPRLAEDFAAYLVKHQLQTGKTRQQKNKYFVRFHMVGNRNHIQAQRIKPLVEKYARQFKVSKSLVYAVIKTESAFNPYAVSSSPAYGLMQIVPTTAGRDTFRKLKGYDHIPSKEYLFNSANNIELGTAYLNILERDYLGAIQHPITREYCTISAYNGGAGNVLRMFSQNRNQALNIINSLAPSQVYQKLRHEHPRNETRRYLRKVLDARKEFVSI
ncbi:MAG: murein transglycosylase domain-containing protein [Thioalkalispiraceae bacterium]|jgi:membrane-bound lytic murein transglycosylase C